MLYDKKQKKQKRPHFHEISCGYSWSPESEFECFWLMKHILPKWWTHPFLTLCEHCWPKCQLCTWDIWYLDSHKISVIFMVTQDKPLNVVTPWPVLLPNCPHLDVPLKWIGISSWDLLNSFSFQLSYSFSPVISFKALALNSLNQGHR